MKNKLLAFCIAVIGGSSVFSSDLIPEQPKTLAATVSGAMGLGLGFGGQLEYAINDAVNLIFPVNYRYVSLGFHAEQSKFSIVSAGMGAKWYVSHYLWPQKRFNGFYLEAKVSLGHAHEKAYGPQKLDNKGFTLALSPAVGYSHLFENSIILRASLGSHLRGFVSPIVQKGFLFDTFPELTVSAGYAF